MKRHIVWLTNTRTTIAKICHVPSLKLNYKQMLLACSDQSLYTWQTPFDCSWWPHCSYCSKYTYVFHCCLQLVFLLIDAKTQLGILVWTLSQQLVCGGANYQSHIKHGFYLSTWLGEHPHPSLFLSLSMRFVVVCIKTLTSNFLVGLEMELVIYFHCLLHYHVMF
jgi:hypothetical protein